jgi:transcriptional regulator with XRE-family HTH domain
MLGTRLREILAARGISKDELAEMCDLPLETIRNIYYGKTPDPKASTVMKISKALNITVNCLMGECSHSSEERALLQYFRMCGHHGRSVILLSAKFEALTAKEEREAKDKHTIPCLIPHGNIYQGIVYDDCEVVDIFTAKEEAYVAIKMVNNDLVPVYCKGDVLLIANRFPANKEYGVFYQHGRAYIRQYIEEENQYRLKCLHNYAKDMIFKRMDEIEYVGTCCGVVRA